MTLETALRRFLLSPNFIQTGNEKPRKGHILGRGTENLTRQPDQNQGGKNANDPEQGTPRKTRGYRKLDSITLGEVKSAYNFFEKQLKPGPYEAWVGTNNFCMIDLVQRNEDVPPAIFGRVSVCHPSDGYVQNIREMELSFPQKEGRPDTVLLHHKDILQPPHGNVQSYYIRVKFLASQEDIADFSESENLFLEKGFILDYSTGYIDLLELREKDRDLYPWLYVVGSRWFASIPNSVQAEVRGSLQNLIQWNKLIFNYHPEKLQGEIKTLNRELGYKPGFTDLFLIETEDPQQTVRIINSTFEKLFEQPMK